RIQQIQKYEQENSAEQEEYEARVTAQMIAADYKAAEMLKALQGKSEERQRSVGVSSQHSDYIQRFDDSDLSAQRNSSPALRTNNNLSNIQRSSQPLTLRNKNSLRSQPQSSGSKEEQTAFKLAKQLQRFQGCTYEQHQQADWNHQEHHQRPDVHPKCSSMADITPLVCGSYNGGTPLPDVLSSPKLMKATDLRGVDCQAAFEGTSPQAAPEDVETGNKRLPHNLCLLQHYTSSRKNCLPKTTFDIDSTCCFPTSLSFAQHGIHWLPKVHSILNLTADIHFGLRVPGYTSNGKASLRYVPLHKIPYYCDKPRLLAS
ncbi:hypothetical protein V502_02553, partial [Pseudogymnoascus sp. VKM F-4520 (FW-2644)]